MMLNRQKNSVVAVVGKESDCDSDEDSDGFDDEGLDDIYDSDEFDNEMVDEKVVKKLKFCLKTLAGTGLNLLAKISFAHVRPKSGPV